MPTAVATLHVVHLDTSSRALIATGSNSSTLSKNINYSIVPEIVDGVFFSPLQGGEWCPNALHNSRVISILLTKTSATTPNSFDAVISCLTQHMAYFVNQFFGLATMIRNVVRV